MGKIIICRTLTMSTIIITLYSCMVTMCMCICTGVSSKNSRSGLVWPDLFQSRPLITCSISVQLCHSPWSYMPRSYLYLLNYLASLQLHVTYVMYSQISTFTLTFGVYSYFLQLHASIYLSLAAKTINNIHNSLT